MKFLGKSNCQGEELSYKESTPRGRGFDLPPEGASSLSDVQGPISNVKGQMSNECQSPKSQFWLSVADDGLGIFLFLPY